MKYTINLPCQLHLPLLGIAFWCFIATSCIQFGPKNLKAHLSSSDTIVVINGVKVGHEEYLLHLRQEIAMTYNYFYQNHGVENPPNFWVTPVKNIRPLDFLKEKTNDKIIKTKIIHALAKEYGIIDGFDFETFKLHWKDYNTKRGQEHKKGNVVYGAITMDIGSYYNYLLTNLELRVKEKIKKETFTPNDLVLKDYYEQIKHGAFTYHERIAIEMFGYQYRLLPHGAAVKKMDTVVKLLDRGHSMKDISNNYQNGNYTQKVFYDSVPIYGEDNPNQLIKRTAEELEPGEYKVAMAQEGIYVVGLSQVPIQKTRPFEEVKNEVLYHYQDKKYRTLLADIKKNVNFNTHATNYALLSPESF